MSNEPSPGSRIAIAAVPNLRDLGGWPIRGQGTVRGGQLYRSTQLDRLQGADMDAFAGLGVRTVYDLRTNAERALHKDQVPEGTEQIPLNVFGDLAGASPPQLLDTLGMVADVLGGSDRTTPASILEILKNPKKVAKELAGNKPADMFLRTYRQIVSLPSALSAYGRMFAGFARPEGRPALFHCTTGKDRTGWGAAAILMFLGVSDSDVMSDFLITNRDLLPSMQPLFDRFAKAGIDRELLLPVAGVRADYLEAAIDEMTTSFGTIEGYFERGLGLDPDAMSGLRMALVEPGGTSGRG